METIYSDGKTLEIERKLKITVYLPQLCHFCREEITTFEPRRSEEVVTDYEKLYEIAYNLLVEELRERTPVTPVI